MTALDATRGAPATSEIRNNLALAIAGTAIREDTETVLTNIDNGLADTLAQHTILFHSDNDFTFTGTALTYATTGLEIKVIHNSTGAVFTYAIPTGETLSFSADGHILYAIIARDGSGTGDTPSTNLTAANNNLVVGATSLPTQAQANTWYIPIAMRIDPASGQLLHWFMGHGTWEAGTSTLVGISGGSGGLDKWETGKEYNQDDVIWYDGDNKIYYCTATGDGHTSGTFATDLGNSYWAELSTESFTDVMTTRGDIIYKNSSGITTRLAVGGASQILTSDGTDISWEDPAVESGLPTISKTAGENLTAGEALYISKGNGAGDAGRTASQVYKLDVTDDNRMEFIGFASENTTSGNTVVIKTTGLVSGLSGLTDGQPVYANRATPGAVTSTPNNTEDEWNIQVGMANSTTGLVINAANSATAVFIEPGTGTSFTIPNNQSTPTNITGLSFSGAATRSAVIDYSIYRKTDDNSAVETGIILVGYNTRTTSWSITETSGCEDSGCTIDITSGGQLTIESSNMSGANYYGSIQWTYTTFSA